MPGVNGAEGDGSGAAQGGDTKAHELRGDRWGHGAEIWGGGTGRCRGMDREGGVRVELCGVPPVSRQLPSIPVPPLLHRVPPTRSPPPPKPLLVLAGRIPASSDPVTNEAAAHPGGAAGAPPSAFRLCPGKFSPPSPPQSWAPGGPGLQGCGQPLAGAACPPSAHNAARCCLINVQIA